MQLPQRTVPSACVRRLCVQLGEMSATAAVCSGVHQPNWWGGQLVQHGKFLLQMHLFRTRDERA